MHGKVLPAASLRTANRLPAGRVMRLVSNSLICLILSSIGLAIFGREAKFLPALREAGPRSLQPRTLTMDVVGRGQDPGSGCRRWARAPRRGGGCRRWRPRGIRCRSLLGASPGAGVSEPRVASRRGRSSRYRRVGVELSSIAPALTRYGTPENG